MRRMVLLSLLIGAGCIPWSELRVGDTIKKEDKDDQDTGDTGTDVEDEPPPVVQFPARGVSIVGVDVYQGVRVPLMEDGSRVSSTVPIVSEKSALLRVFIEPEADFSAREIEMRLTISVGEQEPLVLTETGAVASEWSMGDLASTWNFELDAEWVVPEMTFSVELLELEPGFEGEEASGVSRFPSDGEDALPLRDAGGALRIYMIPVRYNGDGSGRIPDVSENRMADWEAHMEAMFPAQRVEITVLEPMDYNYSVRASGTGWTNLLQAIYQQRQVRGIPYDGYAYGLFEPAASLGNYCGSGCVLGLSALAERPEDAWARHSIGLGFSDPKMIHTFLHEIGHAHGRLHAPCGVSNTDPYFPYSGAALGSWGYDRMRNVLIDPTQDVDLMSYCDPAWISDYTYEALFDRIQAVNNPADWSAPHDAPSRWQTLFVDGEGRVEMGPLTSAQPRREGRPIGIRRLGFQGFETVRGHFAPYDHLPGGVMLVPEGSGLIERVAFD